MNSFVIPISVDDEGDDLDVEEWWDNLKEECRLMQLNTLESQIRISAEIIITFGAFLYLAAAVREARFLGGRMFFENLVRDFEIITHNTQFVVSENISFSGNVPLFLYANVDDSLAKDIVRR